MIQILHTPIPIYLAASLALLAVGPLLFALARTRPRMQVVLLAGVAGTVAGLVFVETLPEAVAGAGVLALMAVVAGLTLPFIVERGHDRPTGVLAAVLAVVALAAHAVTDGLALSLPVSHEHQGLAMAVVLHHVPEGAAVWWLLRDRGPLAGTLALAAIASFTILGFALGDVASPWLSGSAVSIFQAFVSGLLLHVVFEHRPDAGAGTSHGFGWLAGAAGLVLVAHLFAGEHHVHDHEEAHTHVFTLIGALALCGTLVFVRFAGTAGQRKHA